MPPVPDLRHWTDVLHHTFHAPYDRHPYRDSAADLCFREGEAQEAGQAGKSLIRYECVVCRNVV